MRAILSISLLAAGILLIAFLYWFVSLEASGIEAELRIEPMEKWSDGIILYSYFPSGISIKMYCPEGSGKGVVVQLSIVSQGRLLVNTTLTCMSSLDLTMGRGLAFFYFYVKHVSKQNMVEKPWVKIKAAPLP